MVSTSTAPHAEVGPPTEEDETPQEGGAWAYLIAGLVPAAFGGVILVESLALGIGSPTDPRPGFWPFGLSAVLILLSLGLLIGRRRFGTCEAFSRGTFLVLAGAAGIGGFVIALPLVGFEIPSIVLQALWLKVLGRESWRITICVPLVTTAILHVLFIELLGVSLPHLFAF